MRLVALHLRGTYLRRGKLWVSKGLWYSHFSAIPPRLICGLVLGRGRGKKAFVGVAGAFSRGRLQVDKLAAVVLHFDGFWWVVRRVWVVLVVARVLICLVRAFQFVEVAVVAVQIRTGSGLCKRDLSAPQLPAKPQLDHVQGCVSACEP